MVLRLLAPLLPSQVSASCGILTSTLLSVPDSSAGTHLVMQWLLVILALLHGQGDKCLADPFSYLRVPNNYAFMIPVLAILIVKLLRHFDTYSVIAFLCVV